MEYRTLGRTGVKVSPLCLGAMMFGAWGNQDHDDSVRIIHRALDAGINFIDTADVYSSGESEEIVAKALSSIEREHVVLATKVHGRMGRDPNTQATRADGSWPSATTACAGWVLTTSISTRFTGPTPTATSTRHSARSATWFMPARSATSGVLRSLPTRSSRLNGRQSDVVVSGS